MALIQCNIAAQANTATVVLEYLFPGWPPLFLEPLPGASSTDPTAPYPLLDPVTVLEIVSADKDTFNDALGPENRTARMGAQRTSLLRGYTNALIRLINLLSANFLDRDGVRVGLEAPATTYMKGPLDLDGNKISGMADATDTQDLVTFGQFKDVQFLYEDKRDEADQAVLQRDSGLAMAGNLDMGVTLPGQRVINLGIPTQPSHLIIESYSTAQINAFTAAYLPRTGVNPMTNTGAPWEMGNNRILDMGNPTAASDAVTKTFFDALAVTGGTSGVPIGMIMPHMGGTVPSGFLVCDGREVSRTTYAALFAVIGIAYGTPSGGTTFVLPDLRGRLIVGLDNMGGVVAGRVAAAWGSTLAGVGGAQTHALSTSEMPSHTHGFTDRYMSSGAGGAQNGEASPSGAAVTFATTAGVTGSQGSGNAHNNVKPVIAAAYVIRAG